MEQATAEPPTTTLTAFFSLCQLDEFAWTLTYADVPRYYTWDRSKKVWSRCKRGIVVSSHPGIFEAPAIGRVYTVSPRQGECNYLQILLYEVKGPQCFEEVKTVNGTICTTFLDVCQKRGLLDDDTHLKGGLSHF